MTRRPKLQRQRWTAWALLLCGSACGARQPPPAQAEVTMQPCALNDRWTLQVPVAEGFVLAAMPDACMLVDERTDEFAAFSLLATNAEGADLLAADPTEFFRASGLLGESPGRTGSGQIGLLGTPTPTQEWVATLEGFGGRRHVTTLATRQGADWLIVLLVTSPTPPSSRETLQTLLQSITR
ncbi:MAG: hypothetical protein AAGE52_24090 [Myxococcota bacterium]